QSTPRAICVLYYNHSATPQTNTRSLHDALPISHRFPTWSVEKRPASDSTTFALRWSELRLTTLRGQISCKSFCFAVPDRPASPGPETIAEIVLRKHITDASKRDGS